MEMDDSHAGDSDGQSSATTTTHDEPNSVPASVLKAADNDDVGDDSDSDDVISCPLFMMGLPKDFATNPQLAAIASLLDDDDNDDKVEPTNSNEEPPNHERATPPIAWSRNSTCRSTKTHNRRRQQRATPYGYPRQKKQTNNRGKGGSVGELTLFMNMWKP
eukprot:jgi/Psemu1/303232/fgenesh1_kg.97_\